MAAPSTLVDLVKIAILSNGTGAFTLGPAISGYRGTEALLDGGVYSYSVQQDSQFEAGRGTWLASLGQFTRAPFYSSNGNAAVSFGPNAALTLTFLAEDLVALVVPPSAGTDALTQEVKRATAAEAALAQSVARIASGLKSYATLAALNADTTQSVGTLAYVYADPTAANNTIYVFANGVWSVATGFYANLSATVQPLVTQAQTAVAQINSGASFPAAIAKKTVSNWSLNQVRLDNSTVGYLDAGGGVHNDGNWKTFYFNVTPSGYVSLNINLASNVPLVFFNGLGAVVGTFSGSSPAGNAPTDAATWVQVPVPAGAVVGACSVYYFQGSAYGYYNYDVVLRNQLVVLEGQQTGAPLSWIAYEPLRPNEYAGCQAGANVIVIGDSYWDNEGWPFNLWRDMGWASLVKAWRGGRTMADGLKSRADAAAHTTDNTVVSGADIALTKAQVQAANLIILAVPTNNAAANGGAGTPLGSMSDAPATFDLGANGDGIGGSGSMLTGGASYGSQLRGVGDQIYNWGFTGRLVMTTPLYRVGVAAIPSYQAFIRDVGAPYYGASVIPMHSEFGVNPINAAALLRDGVHPTEAQFFGRYFQGMRKHLRTIPLYAS